MTREELIRRWQTQSGREIRAKVIALLQSGKDCCKEIDEAVSALPGASEIDKARWQDLRGIELARLDLHGSHLLGTRFDHANLDGCNLVSSKMHYCILEEASLLGVRASKAMMTAIIAHRARFDGADLSGVDLKNADLQESSFRNANLDRISLVYGRVDGADFRGATFASADIEETSFAHAIVDGPVPSA